MAGSAGPLSDEQLRALNGYWRAATKVGQATRLALDVYVHRLRAGIAAMTASLGGLDVLVFTGGVGEGSATVRELTADGLTFLGVALDPERNATVAAADTDASVADASAATFVIAAREDIEIARQVRTLLSR